MSIKTDVLKDLFTITYSQDTEYNYDVYTEDERYTEMRKRIEDSLWFTNTDILAHYIKSDLDVSTMLDKIKDSMFEDATDVIKLLLGDNLDSCINELLTLIDYSEKLSCDDTEIEHMYDGIMYYVYAV